MYHLIAWLYKSVRNDKVMLLIRLITLLTLVFCAVLRFDRGSVIALGVSLFVEFMRILLLLQYRQVFALMCTITMIQTDANLSESVKNDTINDLMSKMTFVQRVIYDIKRYDDFDEVKGREKEYIKGENEC